MQYMQPCLFSMANTIYTTIAEKIITEQAAIIGPISIEEAKKVQGITVQGDTVSLVGDNPLIVIDALVARYERLFGRASVEVCQDAVRNLLPSLAKEEIPASLRLVV